MTLFHLDDVPPTIEGYLNVSSFKDQVQQGETDGIIACLPWLVPFSYPLQRSLSLRKGKAPLLTEINKEFTSVDTNIHRRKKQSFPKSLARDTFPM